MLWTNQVPVTKMTWDYVFGEVIEVLEAILALSLGEFIAELCDVYTCATCALAEMTGVNLPIVWERSARGWFAREQWWADWLKEQGLPFNRWMMKFGGNYKKAHKRQLVQWMARTEQRLA